MAGEANKTEAVENTGTVADTGVVAAVDTGGGGDGGAAAATAATDGKTTAVAAKGKATTIADEGADVDDRSAPAKFPDDWRQQLAGDDKKALGTLERFASPKALLDAYVAAQKRLSSGKAVPAGKPAEGADEAELKAWREANGIPEAPDKYDIKLRDNRVIGDDDKPIFDDFAKAAHKAGMNNEQMSAAADWYLDLVEREQAEIIEEDENYLAETTRALKEEWGVADYKRNINAALGMFADAPEGVREAILGARMENGRKIGGDATMLKWLAQIGRELNPASTFIPDADNSGRGIEAQIAEIETVMRTDNRKYWNDPAMQKRYGELIGARDAMKARGRAA